jgi:Spy/CpxP family protein refolding chaperone
MKRLAIVVLILAAPALAQDDPFAAVFFPPELIMEHQQAIGLNADQKRAVRAEIQKAQGRFTELQWKLEDEMQALLSLTGQKTPDEDAVLTQLDRVLSLEREIKRTQIGLMVRIKRVLTPEQQNRLRDLRKSR